MEHQLQQQHILNDNYPDAIPCGTPICSIATVGGILQSRSHTFDGNGAQTDNIF